MTMMSRALLFMTMYTGQRCQSFSCFHPWRGKRRSIAWRFVASASSSSSAVPLPEAQLISSPSSNTIKRIKSYMTSRKKRMAAGVTVVEGPRSVLDLLSASPRTSELVQQVLIQECQWDTYAPQILEMQQRQDDENNRRIPLVPVTSAVMDSLADTVTPQGILAIVRIPDTRDLHVTRDGLWLILDGVADPGNVGTLLRSAVAVGAVAVVTLSGTADVFGPKALRSAMGAAFLVPILNLPEWDEAHQTIDKCCAGRIWAATMQDDIPGTPHYDVPWVVSASTDRGPENTSSALVIGNEGQGLSQPIRDALSLGTIQAVHVPMQPNSVESLNAAVCGSIIMFEYQRQQSSTSLM